LYLSNTMNQIKNISPKELAPGITGHYVHGDTMTLGFVELKAGSSIPEHRHRQEQITFIVKGRLDMVIAGETCCLTTGTYYVIPSNLPHSAVVTEDSTVIDVFSPVREDYKT